MIIASAHPLFVAASEVPVVAETSDDGAYDDFGAVLLGMLSGGFASMCAMSFASAAVAGTSAVVIAGVAFPPAVCVMILGVLVALGVSFLVTNVAHVLNEYVQSHSAELQEFLDKIAYNFKNGFLVIKASHVTFKSPGLFAYVRDWVKEHIVGYFDEKHSNTDLSQAVDGFEVLVPSYHFDHKPTNDEVINHVYPDTNNLYGRISWVYSDLEGVESGAKLEKAGAYVLKTNPNTKVSYNLGASMYFNNVTAATRHLFNKIVLKDDVIFTFETYFYSGEVLASRDKSSTYYFCVPYVYEENNVRKLFVANYSSLNTNGSESSLSLRSYLSLPGTNKLYYLNGDRLLISGKTVYTESGNQNLSLVYEDGTVKNTFTDIPEFMYYACCTSCEIQYIDRSTAQVTDTKSNTNISYTTVNNYYNEARDITKKTAEAVRTGVRDGTITDESEGEIAIGTTVLPGIDLTSQDVISTTGISNIAAVTDYTATNVVTQVETGEATETVTIDSVGLVDLPTTLEVGSNNINIALQSGVQRFPFSSYRNVYNYLQNITGISAEAPVIPINIKYMDIDYHDEIDFSFMTNYIKVIHAGLLISYVIGLYMVVRNFIIKKELGG